MYYLVFIIKIKKSIFINKVDKFKELAILNKFYCKTLIVI